MPPLKREVAKIARFLPEGFCQEGKPIPIIERLGRKWPILSLK